MQTVANRRARGKRQITDEMREKAAAKREAFRALAKRVAAMDVYQRQTFIESTGAIVRTSEGRSLSLFNSCLILHQLPSASLVGGYRQWQAAGRQVMKGEHGLMIWIPCGKAQAQDTPAQGDLDGVQDEERPRFIIGTVFDISQTCEAGAACAELQCAA